MAAPNVGESKAAVHTDATSLTLSPSRLAGRREDLLSSLSTSQSFPEESLTPKTSTLHDSSGFVPKQTTSSDDSAKQQKVFSPVVTQQQQSTVYPATSGAVYHSVRLQQVSSSSNSNSSSSESRSGSVKSDEEGHSTVFRTPVPERATTFVQSSTGPGLAEGFSSAEKSALHCPSTAATMVAMSASHRPTLYKSHSVAYGIDSTVSQLPPPPPPMPQQHPSHHSAMSQNPSGQPPRAARRTQAEDALPLPLPTTTEHHHHHFPTWSSSPSLLSSSSTGEKSSSPLPPHPAAFSRGVAAENLPHQSSFGFAVPPEPRRQPLRRCESLRSDSITTARDTVPWPSAPGSETMASTGSSMPGNPRGGGRGGRDGGGGGPGKWRSSPSCSRRSSFRNQPLARSASVSSSGAAPHTGGKAGRLASASSVPAHPLSEDWRAQGPHKLEDTAADSLARNNQVVSNVPENPEVPRNPQDAPANYIHAEGFRSSNPAEDGNIRSEHQSLSQGSQLTVVEQAERTLTDAAHRTVHPSGTDQEMLPRGFRETQDVDMDSAQAAQTMDSAQAAAQTLTQPTQCPPFRRQLSRRRSYQQATADSDSAPTSAAAVAADDDDDDDDGRGVRVEDVFEEEEEEEEEGCLSFTPPPTPRPAKTRRVDMSNFDPYQVFEVQHLPCIILTVKVIRGRNITNGWAQDLLDTPDPYVKLRLKTAPEGRQRTSTIANNPNPVWNETFTFFLGFSETNVLEVTLMEENPLRMDQETGTIFFNVNRIREFGKLQDETFNFNGVSEIDVEFHMEWDQNPTLRYSLCLSDQEKEFMRKRKQKVWQALNALLGEQGPKTLDETPTIAVIGSGGGFRAMTGYSGVFKALADSGLLDCATYVCGLSGSSWYLSTLYSHERWPEMSPAEMQGELQGNIDKSLVWQVGRLYRYVRSVVGKRRQGQPVSFTDFFGHMVGETLLKGRLESRLTDQRQKIDDARVPMPLYTCVHVKKDVPARSFQEWVEFSPYEIGMPKYGTFMDSKYFGSKFFMGKLVKAYEEPPLHFLQGIWGSAFCILFKRLLDDNRNLDPAEMIRREMELRSDLGSQLEQGPEDDDDDSSDISDDDDDEEETDDTDEEAGHGTMTATTMRRSSSSSFSSGLVPASLRKPGSPASDSEETSEGESSENDLHHNHPPRSLLARHDSSEGFDDVDCRPEPPSSSISSSSSSSSSQHVGGTVGASSPRPICRTSSPGADRASSGMGVSGSPDGPKKGVRFSRQVDQFEQRKAQQQQQQPQRGRTDRKPLLKRASTIRRGKSRSYWSSILRGVIESQSCELLSTRAGRAAVIHNFMRGLNLQQTYPLSPFTPLNQRVREGDEFDGIFDLHPTHIKHIYMVDAGLTFNSPYPLILRPQRGVDVILSFDFSARDSDSTPPFKELLLAEKWAKLNRLPFPPIDPSVVDREGLKEVYVFRDPHDPHCPIVLHFPLVNIHFRNFKAPGVPRETKEDKDFANFDIFDDPTAPFSTFNFTYTARNFQRLSQLTEFNTLHSLGTIRKELARAVAQKRQASPRVPIQPRDFKLLRMKSVQERRELKKFLSKMQSRGGSSSSSSVTKTPTPPHNHTPSPFFTPGWSPKPSSSSARREKNPFVFSFQSSSSSSGRSSSSQGDGRNPFFSTTSRPSSSSATSPVSPRTSRRRGSSSTRSPRSPSSSLSRPAAQSSKKRQDQGQGRRLVASSRDSSQEFMSTSSVPFPPSPAPSSDSYDDVFSRSNSSSSPSSTPTTNHPSPFHHHHKHDHKQQQQQQHTTSLHIGNLRQESSAVRPDLEQKPEDSLVEEGGEGEEEFHDAPEAFTRDGEGVTDPRLAKMYYEGAKERRSRFRRQSTISSLNSLAESISLDSEAQTLPSTNSYNSRASSLSSGPLSIDIADLRQFQGIVDDHDDNNDDDTCNKAKVSTSRSDNDTQSMDDNNDDDGCNKVNGSNSHSDNDNQSMDDDDDDDLVDENVEEHWFDGGSSGEHRGSVIRLEGREGS
ncbi:uncharacterized protein LOC143275440 [Babylonia areolata]|uniref:uncharacterized protein LOC143275440 n=1 Tax=Babylonia areolata TaxID=304850 RepID=UPI003FD35F00